MFNSMDYHDDTYYCYGVMRPISAYHSVELLRKRAAVVLVAVFIEFY